MIEKFNKLSTYIEDDFYNGAETVEIVFGIVLAVGLGAALILFQDTIVKAFSSAQNSVNATFNSMSKPANVGR